MLQQRFLLDFRKEKSIHFLLQVLSRVIDHFFLFSLLEKVLLGFLSGHLLWLLLAEKFVINGVEHVELGMDGNMGLGSDDVRLVHPTQRNSVDLVWTCDEK